MAAALANGILQNIKNSNLIYKIRLENSRAIYFEIGDMVEITNEGIFSIDAIDYCAICELSLGTVSYTHLDVYKRQR